MSGRGRYLAVDTSTEACSAALWVEGRVLERFRIAGREHTRFLLPMLRDLLSEAGTGVGQLDGLACGAGPGSFTGLRIGVGLVMGLAAGRDLPVVGVSSLAMLAQAALHAHPGATVAAVIDARLNEVYLGAYRRGPHGLAQAMVPDYVSAPAGAARLPEGRWVGVGNGWQVHEGALRQALGVPLEAMDAGAMPRASAALELALPDLVGGRAPGVSDLAPRYLQDKVARNLAEQRAAKS